MELYTIFLIFLVNGVYGLWTEWTSCSQTCEGGSRTRERACDSPEALYGGEECTEHDFETEDCNEEKCPVVDPNAPILEADEGLDCKQVGEKCMNVKYLRLHNKCENLVFHWPQQHFNKTIRKQ